MSKLTEDINWNKFFISSSGRKLFLWNLSFNMLYNHDHAGPDLLIVEATVSCLLFCHKEHCFNEA
jgi:hypothetical protein